MLEAILGALHCDYWRGRRHVHCDDLAARLDSAQSRFERTSLCCSNACVSVKSKIKRADTATNVAIKLMGATLVCGKMRQDDPRCSGCPWETDCPLFEHQGVNLP